MAELKPIKQDKKTKRPIGLAKGQLKVTKEFFEPLPEEVTKLFSGEKS